MSETTSPFDARQGMAHPFWGHLVVERATGRILGGAGRNPHRAWAFPLNTPRGLNVIQEYSFDHPFHNGVFVGQGNVIKGGRTTNFWSPSPDFRQEANAVFHHLGDLRYSDPPRVEPHASGVRFTFETTWRDETGEPVLDEVRTIDIRAAKDATVCDVTSRKAAAHGPLEFGVTKYGTIGARVQPQLLPPFGGQILAGDGGNIRRGRDDIASTKPCDWVAYESEPPGLWRFGLCLRILDNTASPDRRGPWFIRDYGMAMFNATMKDAIKLEQGQVWTTALRVVAYDGPLTIERAAAWARL